MPVLLLSVHLLLPVHLLLSVPWLTTVHGLLAIPRLTAVHGLLAIMTGGRTVPWLTAELALRRTELLLLAWVTAELTALHGGALLLGLHEGHALLVFLGFFAL